MALTFDQALPIVQAITRDLSDTEKIRLLEWVHSPQLEKSKGMALKGRRGGDNGPSDTKYIVTDVRSLAAHHASVR